MNKIKKIITNITIVLVALCGLIGFVLLFKIVDMDGIVSPILLSFIALIITGIFLITCIDVFVINKKIGIVSLSSMILSGLLFIILIWIGYIKDQTPSMIFIKIDVTVAALSLLFNLVFSIFLKMHKRLLILQLVCYLSFTFIEFMLTYYAYASEFLFDKPGTIIISAFIIFVVSYIILRIQSNKEKEESTITISLEEYNYLKNRIKELEKKQK